MGCSVWLLTWTYTAHCGHLFCPKAILIHNDGANHQPSGNGGYNTQRTLEIIKRLNPKGQSRGLIDAVGIQLHINAAKPPNIDNITKTIEMYGLPLYVTEFEVNVDRVIGSPERKAQIQGDLYKKILTALLKSDSVVMVSQWSATSDNETTGRLFDCYWKRGIDITSRPKLGA